MFSTFFQKITQFFKKKKVEKVQKKYEIWQEDCLGYQDIAINFTKIIKTIKDQHRIISLEANSGLGKTFFLRNWTEELKRQNEIAVYYNAWNPSALEQPFPPLLSFMFDNLFISKKIKKSIVRKFKNINDQLFSLDTLSKLISKSPLGMFSVFVDVTKEAEKKEMTINELTAYNTRKQNMEDFKTQLAEIIDKIRNGQNIYILIDNLELCRTKYIVDFFEHVKYTLNIDGLVFILAIDKDHSNARKAVNSFYGTQDLKRFFDLSLFLPKISAEKFIRKQFESVSKTLKTEILLISSFIFYAEGFSLSLKNIKRCIYEINLLFLLYPQSKLPLPNLFSFLITLRLVNNKFYESLDMLSIEDALTILDKEIKPMFVPIISKSKQEWESLKIAIETTLSNTNANSKKNTSAKMPNLNLNNIKHIKKMISYVA